MARQPSQEQKILAHLRSTGTISPLEALHLYKVRDLPKRISVLKSRGHRITGLSTKDMTGARYKRYFFI